MGIPRVFKQPKSNKQSNKETSKQTKNFMSGQYISQIKSDLHEAFRKISCGNTKMIKKQMHKPTNDD